MDFTHEEAHELAREKGSNPVLYFILRVILVPVMKVFFGLQAKGVENIPKTGPVVIAPNHKSFWDAFFLAAVVKRRMHFMGKAELFQGWRGRLFVSLGAFPVLRGESDDLAIGTARAVLERGDVLALFPEGTRVSDPDKLGDPKRGATRLAIETGAVIIPTAMSGTEKRKWPLPRKVRIVFGEPVPVTDLQATPEHAGMLLDQTVWPTISEEYAKLRNTPGLIAGGLAAAGIGYALYRRSKKN
ncbi:lysophospholipid acyltransferase family protein [Nocardioides marmorisolisilvae]|uniref:1-acyl-sn-glycerol-3-phosphate acyltransferase n=1 Tax=Nocardioides marmorisolisilvae TaxID=1542737 RepID=A0A3N0DPX2_9ACTN|nr:lysophospholipid acyltransferase family protein [Nocardioides marmorisolisilvae]RNL77700.1 1-acyl-sn-glycerol-3-phosphate acyltransferase [Nocardioides marmorisolisilvae]